MRSSSSQPSRLSKLASRLSSDDLNKPSPKEFPPKNFKSLVVGCGSDMLGQLHSVGNKEITAVVLKPTLLPLETDDVSVMAISAGPQLSACVLQRREATEMPLPEGTSYVDEVLTCTLYVWGQGLGQTFKQPTAVQFPKKDKEKGKDTMNDAPCPSPLAGSIRHTLRGVMKVSCGHDHMAVIDHNGHCWTWGDGAMGKLGHGSRTSLKEPKLVAALASKHALSVACGGSTTCVVACERAVFAAGRHRVVVPSTGRGSTGGSSSKTSSRASSRPSRGALGTRLDDVQEGDEDEDDNEDDGKGTQGRQQPGSAASTATSADDVVLLCGDLYVCGSAKAGQLGLDASKGTGSSSSSGGTSSFVAVPTRVTSLDREEDSQGSTGYVVAKGAAGMHHTLVLAVALASWQAAATAVADDSGGGGGGLARPESFVTETAVYSCGYGEHGRLGHGDEESRSVLTRVVFPATGEVPGGGGITRSFYNSFNTCGGGKDFFRSGVAPPSFTPTDVAAGEQHSLVSGRCGGAFSWGANDYGQCGLGAPSTTAMALSPTAVPLPEGVHVRAIACGGRHSSALTSCGKVLLFGWGDDAQCGGAEKSVYWPRPVRLPRLDCDGAAGGRYYKMSPTDLALGMSHSLVLLRHEDHVPPAPKKPRPVPAEVVAVVVAEASAKVPSPPGRKSAVLVDEDDDGEGRGVPPAAVRGIRELLAIRREEQEDPVVTNQAAEEAVEEDVKDADEEEEEEAEEENETSVAFFMTEEDF
jgi:alpha-tubulin suppressor-like RCC1 family protein